MNCDDLQRWAALGALEALEGEDRERFEEALTQDERLRQEVARFRDTLAAWAAGLPRTTPPASLKNRILGHIRSTTPVAAAPSRRPAPASPLPAGFHGIDATAPWVPSIIPGVRHKLLSTAPEQGYGIILVELEPGTRYPEHEHSAAEGVYLLTGDLLTEGRLLGPGDFIAADPGSHHHELVSPGGCTALLVTSMDTLRRLKVVPA